MRHVVDDLRGEQRFEQADRGHGRRIGGDDGQRFPVQRHIGQREIGQAFGQFAHVGNRIDRRIEEYRQRGEHDDRDQRAGHGGGDLRDQVDHRQRGRDHGIGHPADPCIARVELRQLRHEDEDRQRVDEAGDDRTADELHQQVEPQQRGNALEYPHQYGRGEEIFDPVIAHQRHHHHGHRRSRRRDHARASAGKGNHHRDRDRGIEPDARIDPGDDREADRLGYQRQRDDEPGEHVGADVGEPVAVDRGTVEHGKCPVRFGKWRTQTGAQNSHRPMNDVALQHKMRADWRPGPCRSVAARDGA